MLKMNIKYNSQSTESQADTVFQLFTRSGSRVGFASPFN